jgi:hypothetical protein
MSSVTSVASALQMATYDLRPYHITMALLHIVYLIGTYALLAKEFGRNFPTLFAFAIAVPNFIFFSYSPFVSHDIFPGVLLLAMVVYTGEYLREWNIKSLAILVIAGALAATIKHIYGIFWIAILFSYFLLAFLAKRKEKELLKWSELFALSIVSGIIAWLLMSWSLRGLYQDTIFLLKPLKQLEYLADAYGTHPFPIWIYFANAWAYGIIAVALLPIGLWMSWKGNLTQRIAFLSFTTIILIMHVIEAREVRYLAPLSPLAAYLAVPAIRLISHKITARLSLVALLLITALPFHQYSISMEAIRIFNPFYQRGQLDKIQSQLTSPKGVLFLTNTRKMSFTSPFSTPFRGDPYHQIFHIEIHHLPFLLGNESINVSQFNHPAELEFLEDWPDQTVIHITNAILANSTTWEREPPIGLEGFYRIFLIDDHVSIVAGKNNLTALDSKNNILDENVMMEKQTNITIHSNEIAHLLSTAQYPRIHTDTEHSSNNSTYRIHILSGAEIEILESTHLSLEAIPTKKNPMKLKYFKRI